MVPRCIQFSSTHVECAVEELIIRVQATNDGLKKKRLNVHTASPLDDHDDLEILRGTHLSMDMFHMLVGVIQRNLNSMGINLYINPSMWKVVQTRT